MAIVRAINFSVLVIRDIYREGEFSPLVGTLEVLQKEDREIIKYFIINKFRKYL